MIATSVTAATETACRISDAVRDACSRRSPLRIRGAGRWLDAGAPVQSAEQLAVGSDSGIVEYVPGDLTLTALAGTTISAINARVAEDAQWLAMDPFGGEAGTIGATIATASSGPLAQMYGTPRDQLLGVEFVTGSGDVVRGGGRVTKNVAGFDLSRLVCGAWGTIGVITEVTLRLRALPESDLTLAVPLSGDSNELALLLSRLRDSGVAPAAMELLSAPMYARLPLEGRTIARELLMLRFCGNEAGVRVQAERLRGAAQTFDCPTSAWTLLTESDLDRENAMVLRLSSRPSQLPLTWTFAMSLAERFPGSFVHASVGRGIVRCIIPVSWQNEMVAALAARPAAVGAIIFEKLPAALWSVLAPPDAISDRLNKRVRDAFDPQRVLNRGILGEGPL